MVLFSTSRYHQTEQLVAENNPVSLNRDGFHMLVTTGVALVYRVDRGIECRGDDIQPDGVISSGHFTGGAMTV